MLLTSVLALLVVVLAYFVWRFSIDATKLKTQYSPIVDIEASVAGGKQALERVRSEQSALELTSARERLQREQEHQRTLDAQTSAAKEQLEKLQRESESFVVQDQQRRAKLTQEYDQALSVFNELKREMALVEESLEDISFGLYKPHFSFESPEAYKYALTQLNERERVLIANGGAATCPIHWRVGDSEKEGTRMVKQTIKLVLRAFNGECEGARANVSWNNITKMEERIRKSCEAMNKLSGVLQITVAPEYLDLKLNELRLEHELEERKYKDREEQRRIREQIREEERAQREFEKAKEDAEEDEVRYQKALAKAREEAALATGAALDKLTRQIDGFEAKLDEARKKKERAISRAELTKSGFVYVISNVGSFGEDVYKIGMTRRLEPMERVLELGGASVPFPFDLHAMLYSDDAPQLEAALHQLFAERRLNLVNPRREFYHNVALGEIEDFVRSKGLSAQFIKDVEAREYRETVARRQQTGSPAPAVQPQFAQSLFSPAGASSATASS